MGADLIGYMCLGPTHIDDPHRNRAKIKAKKVFGGLHEWWLRSLESDEKPQSYVPREIRAALDDAQIDEPSWLEGMEFGNKSIETAQKEDIEKLVDEIVDFWNSPDTRDSVYRQVSKRTKVVFCGDMSWGDEPSGYGYCLLKMAHVLGIAGELGIR